MTERLIRTDGAELRVDDRGRDEPAFVFLHYWGGSARTWAPVVERLPTTTRTVAVNQRGWGGSRAMDGRHDLQALADDVVALVETLGIRRYVLVGVNRRARLTPVRLRRLTPVIEQIVQCGQYVAGRPAGSLLQADRGSTPAPIYIDERRPVDE